MTPAWIDARQWVPLNAPLRGAPGNRSAAVYTDVCGQFDLLHATRYQPVRRGASLLTYCKTYVEDCLDALGVGDVAAHWVDKVSGARTGPSSATSREVNANELCDRLRDERFAWLEVPEAEAYARADLGFPTIAAGKGESHGHVVMVLPGRLVAGAGARCVWQAPIRASFGALPHTFFTHP